MTTNSASIGATRWQAAGFFVLRTPLLPYDVFESWSLGLAAGVDVGDAASLVADRQVLRERLRTVLARPEVREALFIASPSLDASLPAWIEAPESPRGRKVERTLVRYFARMATRPTPFGLFAGCSLGRIAERTELRLQPLAEYRRHPRLDCGYLAALTDALARDPAIRRELRYRSNDSAHRAAGRLRYVEARLDGGTRTFFLTAVSLTPPIEALLARCIDGASFAQLVDAVAVAAGVEVDEAAAFVDEVIDAQVIVAELQAPITGSDALADLAAQLRNASAAAAAAEILQRIRTELVALGDLPLGAPSSRYSGIAEGLKTLPVDADPSRLFQVDLSKPAVAHLGRDVIAEIDAATQLLEKTSRPRNDQLSRFAEAFVARYEEREVPLGEVLDEDIGIGFERSMAPSAEPSPLLDGLVFGRRPAGDSQHAAPIPLLARLADALARGAREIALAADEMAANAGDGEPSLPSSAAAIVTLAGPSPEAVSRGEFRIWVRSIIGPSGANLLGRFCHTDTELAEQVRGHLRREEETRPDALFAEIVHLPEGRVGNVIARPLLREWEIPYLGRSGAPSERHIPVDDLLVSVRGGRVRLRSRRLGREVIPRLTTAHRHTTPRCLGVYRFLCALQSQDTHSLAFDWGPLALAPFLPRVRCGRVVLSLARWRLERADLQALRHDHADDTFRAVQALRRRLALPRLVAIADGDHVLPIDLDNALAVETFAQMVRGRSAVIVTELFAPDGLCAHGPEGRFVHELIVPLERAPMVDRVPVPSPPAVARTSAAPRRFPPGSDWLYLKLYASAGAVDEVMSDLLGPVVTDVVAARAVDRWFFVRYSDPDWHVRLRFRGEPRRLHEAVLPRLNRVSSDAVSRGLVWRVQLDTYEREIERYGGDVGVELAEELFWADSDAVVAALQALRDDGAAETRWCVALRGIDGLLDDLAFSLEEKRTIVADARASLAREHGVDASFERQLGDKFRRQRRALEALLARERENELALVAPLLALARRSERCRPVAARLRAAERDGILSQPVARLAASFVHMHANRLLRSAARAQELVLYDFLTRLYDGQLARSRRAATGDTR